MTSIYNPKGRRSHRANAYNVSREVFGAARDGLNKAGGSYLLRFRDGGRVRVRNVKCSDCGTYFRDKVTDIERYKVRKCPDCRGVEWVSWQKISEKMMKNLKTGWGTVKSYKLSPSELKEHLANLKKRNHANN